MNGVDGSAFEGAADGRPAGEVGEPFALRAIVAIAPAAPASLKERLALPIAVGFAAAAHLAMLVAMLPVEADALGEGGVAPESVAVAIVERVPMVSLPSAGAQASPVEEVADEPQQEAASADTARKVEADPPKPAEVVPEPSPDGEIAQAITPVAEPKPDEPPKRVVEPPAQDTVQQPATAAAALSELVAAVAAVEASSGVVKAYESQLSRIIASRPPRSRGLRGRVVVELVIGKDGKPKSTTVIEPSGQQALDAAVVAALQRLQFPVPPLEMTLRQRTFHQAFVYN